MAKCRLVGGKAYGCYRVALKNLEEVYVQALKEWEQALSKTHQTVVSYVESVIRSGYVYARLYRQVMHLIAFCLEESEQFIELCCQIKENSQAAKESLIAKTVLDHIIQESEYFIGLPVSSCSASICDFC